MPLQDSFKPGGNVQNLRLAQMGSVPTEEDLQFALAQASKNPKNIVELPWKSPDNPASFIIKVTCGLSMEEPRWILYGGPDGESAVLWNYDSADIGLIHSLITAECERGSRGAKNLEGMTAFPAEVQRHNPEEKVAQSTVQQGVPAIPGLWINPPQPQARPAGLPKPAVSEGWHTGQGGSQSSQEAPKQGQTQAQMQGPAQGWPSQATQGGQQVHQQTQGTGQGQAQGQVQAQGQTQGPAQGWPDQGMQGGQQANQQTQGAGQGQAQGQIQGPAQGSPNQATQATQSWPNQATQAWPNQATQAWPNQATQSGSAASPQTQVLGQGPAQGWPAQAAETTPGQGFANPQPPPSHGGKHHGVAPKAQGPGHTPEGAKAEQSQSSAGIPLFQPHQGLLQPQNAAAAMSQAPEWGGEGTGSHSSKTTLPEPVVLDREAVKSIYKTLTNPDTGFMTYGAFLFHLVNEFARFQRYKQAVSVVRFEVCINPAETNPPPVSTAVLAVSQAGKRIFPIMRPTDWIGHFEGEYAILLPHTERKEAERLAHEISSKVNEGPIVDGVEPGVMRFFFGVASMPEDCEHPGVLLAAAGEAKEHGKRSGLPVMLFADVP